MNPPEIVVILPEKSLGPQEEQYLRFAGHVRRKGQPGWIKSRNGEEPSADAIQVTFDIEGNPLVNGASLEALPNYLNFMKPSRKETT